MTERPFDVVILSSVEWDAAWQRHHAFAALWARAGHRVFFVENTGFREPHLGDLGRIANRLRRMLGGRYSRRTSAPKGIVVVTPLVLPPTRRIFREANAALLAPRLAKQLHSRGLRRNPVAFAYLPTTTTLSILDQLSPSLVIYDCVDNFYGLPSPPLDLAKTEAELMARAGLVLTTSRTLCEDKKPQHPNVVELHHGVSRAFFIPAPPDRPHRRLCYFGTLWRAIDYEPIRALAEAGFAVELIGPVKEPPPPLPPSVILRGSFPHDELPALLADCDALLLPYTDNEYNRGVIPAKTHECLATGRPVLASPLPALVDLSQVLTICRTPEEWVAAARSLDTTAARRARIETAHAHVEEAVFARLSQLVDAARKRAAAKAPALPRHQVIKVFEVLECGGPGGTGNQVAALCNGLDAKRFEASLVYAVRPGTAPQDYRCQALGARKAYHIPDMVREIAPLRDAAAFIKLYSLFKRELPDVVHAHSSKAGVLARWAAWLAGVPRIFYTPHGYGFLQQDRSTASRALYLFLERSTSWIGTIIAVSPSEAALAKPLTWGQPVEVVCDPFLGELPERQGPEPHEGLLVGACGRLTHARNPDAFVKLAQRLTDSRNQLKCVWIGGGEQEADTRRHIEDMNLTGRLDITGWLPSLEAQRRIRSLDVLIHYSRWDGLPNAVLEAMAHGLPVVASDVAGARDAVVHGETGFLAKDEIELLEFTLRLVDNPELRRHMGAAGRQRVETLFHLEAALAKLERLYANDAP